MSQSTKLLIFYLIITLISSQSITLRSFPNELLVNEYSVGQQSYPTVYKLANEKNIIIVWHDVPLKKLLMQIYDSVGTKQGSNLTICTNCTYNKTFLVDLSNRKFAATYYDLYTTMKLKIYDYNGNVILGPVNASSQTNLIENIYITKLDDGTLVIAWIYSATKFAFSIVTQTGTIIAESSYTNGYNIFSLVMESFSNNRFIICWREHSAMEYIYLKIFNSLGTPVQQITAVSFPIVVSPGFFSMGIKRAPNDNIAICYHRYVGSLYLVYIWVCNSNGVAIYGPAEVNSYSINHKLYPRMAVLSNGYFMVTYTDAAHSVYKVYVQEFDDTFKENGGRNQGKQ
jgi:hypothetical protein